MTQKTKIASVTGLVLSAVGAAALYWAVLYRDRGVAADTIAEPHAPVAAAPVIELSSHDGHVSVTADGMKTLGIETAEVQLAPPPEPVRLPGLLLLDPNRMVRVHARFPGELVSLGVVQTDDAPTDHSRRHTLRYGDKVVKGQIMAIVASKDIGEKKSELVSALVQSAIDKKLLSKYEALQPGAVPNRTIQDTRRKYEADLIAVAKVERTLRSWRLTEEELQHIHKEAQRVQDREHNDPDADRTWAEIEVRAPIDGLIVEKNCNAGDMIDPTQDLFKVADLSRVQVVANAYEEDLPLLRALKPRERVWRIDIKADPNDVPIAGPFDIVGNIIDPSQHSGAVMGPLDNHDGHFSIGEFITATVDLPADAGLVLVPTLALVEATNISTVFVETQTAQHDFVQRQVAVARRGRERAFVRREPTAAEKAQGAEPLAVGERVIATGALELAAKLKRMRVSGTTPTQVTSATDR